MAKVSTVEGTEPISCSAGIDGTAQQCSTTPNDVELNMVVVAVPCGHDGVDEVATVEPSCTAAEERRTQIPMHSMGHGTNVVSELDFFIQRDFRKKLLTLLLLQLCFTLMIAFIFRLIPVLRNAVEIVFPPQSISALVLLLLVCCGIPTMALIKEKHPWNMVFTAVWSLLLGIFIAASDLPGAYFKSHVLFTLFVELAIGVFFLLCFSLLSYQNVETNNEPVLWSFGVAGFFSYILWLTISAVVYAKALPADFSENDAHFATMTVAASLIFIWLCYDSAKLCRKMQPDDYMKGVLCLYTDLFYMCMCCCLVCVGGSAGSAGA